MSLLYDLYRGEVAPCRKNFSSHPAYRAANKEAENKYQNCLEKLGKSYDRDLDRLVSAYNSLAFEFGALTFEQGMRFAVQLFKALEAPASPEDSV